MAFSVFFLGKNCVFFKATFIYFYRLFIKEEGEPELTNSSKSFILRKEQLHLKIFTVNACVILYLTKFLFVFLQVYYVYGFMLLVFVILIIVTICVTIVGTYFLLNAENYHWQWTSFFSAASTAVYVYLYSIYYYYVKTKMSGFFQTSFYFGYTLMFCLGLGMLCGEFIYFIDISFMESRWKQSFVELYDQSCQNE